MFVWALLPVGVQAISEQDAAKAALIPIISLLLLDAQNTAPVLSGEPDAIAYIYRVYHFTPVAFDAENDALTFSITNLPDWANFDTHNGRLSGTPSNIGDYSDILISVSDGEHSVNLPAFSIEVLAAIDLAHAHGIATQGSTRDGLPAANAIDHDPATRAYTQAVDNWWQVELIDPTSISKVVIQDSYKTYRLEGATVHISDLPYATGVLNDANKIGTLTNSNADQIFELDTTTQGKYLIIKAPDGNKLSLASVEVYGSLPIEPYFNQENTVERIDYDSTAGRVIIEAGAQDYQQDGLTYWLQSGVPFAIDAQGQITATEPLMANHAYHFWVYVSDGDSTTSTQMTIVIGDTPAGMRALWMDYSEDYSITNNMNGDLPGQLWLLQSQMHRPASMQGDSRPDVVAYRAALLLFMMEDASGVQKLKMRVINQHNAVYEAQLEAPADIPLSDQKHIETTRPILTFSKRSWTGEIPWEFITPGMSIELIELDADGASQRSALLNPWEIEIGTPHEIMLNAIDLGLLVEPRGDNDLVYNPQLTAEYAVDYFQTVPVAKYTLARYAPAHFPKVVLSDGTVYTDKSASTNAGVYSGDMREQIAKSMVSIGINKANIGQISNAGSTRNYNRTLVRNTVAHTAQGRYTDSTTGEGVVVVHGLSGGGAKLTLNEIVGYEFSHEYGHDHGLSHDPGGILALHNYTSGWRYDTNKKRLVANLKWESPAAAIVNGAGGTGGPVAPYKNLYSYNEDAMGGRGAVSNQSAISRFNFYTPHSAYLIQNNLQASGMLDPGSSTGYSQWNTTTLAYEENATATPEPEQTEIHVMTLLGYYDPENTLESFIYPALYSNYGNFFSAATLNAVNTDASCRVTVTQQNGVERVFNLEPARVDADKMNQFQLNLPSNIIYSKAEVKCGASVLDSRNIAALNFDLGEAVKVGKEHGIHLPMPHIPTFAEAFANMTFSTLAQFKENVSNQYSSIQKHTPGKNAHAREIYTLDEDYYIALADTLTEPNMVSGDWLFLGNSADYLVTTFDTLKLGETSQNYTTLLGSSSYFHVPIQENRIRASETTSGGRWYAPGHSRLTVIAVNKLTGEKQDIIIRGQLAAGYTVDSGRTFSSRSTIRFYLEQGDNPALLAGEYDVSFYAYGTRWHDRSGKINILVEGTVNIP